MAYRFVTDEDTTRVCVRVVFADDTTQDMEVKIPEDIKHDNILIEAAVRDVVYSVRDSRYPPITSIEESL